MPVGFGDERMLDDELAEEGDGRRWDDHGPQWVAKEGKKDGFVSTLTRMVSILPEGKLLWGGSCQRVEVEEIDVRPCGVKGGEKNDPEDPNAWEVEIRKAGIGGEFVFSDGSLLERWSFHCRQEWTRTRGRVWDWGRCDGLGWRDCRHGGGLSQTRMMQENISRLEGSHRGSQKSRQNR